MLDLNSNRWVGLSHAYGCASDIPGLLTRLDSGDESSLDDLWGALCHQGSVYSASFAAVPNLVDQSFRTQDCSVRARLLTLIGSIAASTDNRCKHQIDPDIVEDYSAALPRAQEQALNTLQESLDEYDAVYLLQAAANLSGRMAIGRMLSGFVDEEFIAKCPSCTAALYIWPNGTALCVAAEDPVFVPLTPRSAIEPLSNPESPFFGEFSWLTQVGGCALPTIRTHLPYLFGSTTCPLCNAKFAVMDALVESG